MLEPDESLSRVYGMMRSVIVASEHSRSEYLRLRFATVLALLAAEVPLPSLPHFTASPQTDEEPLRYLEVQGYESPEFLTYFPSFTTPEGGVATGFHHVTAADAPPLDVFKLYHVVSPQGSSPNRVIVREVDSAPGLCYGDVYVLDNEPV